MVPTGFEEYKSHTKVPVDHWVPKYRAVVQVEPNRLGTGRNKL